MVPIEMSSTHSYSAFIHVTLCAILHRLATIHKSSDRQSDWNRPPMLLHWRPKNSRHRCRSIGSNLRFAQPNQLAVIGLVVIGTYFGRLLQNGDDREKMFHVVTCQPMRELPFAGYV